MSATTNTPARPVDGEQGNSLSKITTTLVRTLLVFYIVNLGYQKFIAKPPDASNPSVPKFAHSGGHDAAAPKEYTRSLIPQLIAPIWPTNSSLDINVYISSSLAMPSLTTVPLETLVVQEREFGLGNWSDNRVIDTVFKVPKEVQNNGTLWAHIYVALHGYPMDPIRPEYDVSKAYRVSRMLNQVLPKKKIHKTKKLLEATSHHMEEDAPNSALFGSFYHPNTTISFIPDSGTTNYIGLHPASRQHYHLEGTDARDPSGQHGWYFPTIYMNQFWQLKDHMMELNDSVNILPLHIDLNNLNNWKFNLYAAMDDSMKQNTRAVANGASIGAAGDGSEFEMIKSVILDTNIYLLSTTVIVSILHMIFEMLAFKNDISHWRNKKDNVGVSMRTILANVFMQTIIFLYLMDNSDGTSYMILFGQGLGIVLEAWKITKTVDVRIRAATPGAWLPYRISFEDKHRLSEIEKKTQEYDQIAFQYMYVVAIPLIGAYAIYSLMYESHKSWYSFIITTLVGSVYAYGFLMMVPSLYINYRLKSVAHMPAKAMTYKFLNTFIDDLFAFTIKMPTLHRLATLRDDVIFFVYLYQSYKYKVDFTRINEFGQGGDDEKVDGEVAGKAEGETRERATGKPSGKLEESTTSKLSSDSNSRATGVDTQEGLRQRN